MRFKGTRNPPRNTPDRDTIGARGALAGMPRRPQLNALPVLKDRGAAAVNLGYQITNSLRMRGSNNASLYRTVGTTTNRRTFTFSKWMKIGSPGVNHIIWQGYQNASNYNSILINSAGIFQYQQATAAVQSALVQSPAVFRDPTAHGHLVVQVDTTDATDTNRVRAWWKGVPIPLTPSGAGWPSLNQDTFFNVSGNQLGWGYETTVYSAQSDGLHSEVICVDGSLVAPTAFAETNPATGEWVPKRYTGSYGGVNGGYWPFNDAASTVTIGQDRSGNAANLTSSGTSVTAGITFDQSLDTPSNNVATLDPLSINTGNASTLRWANLQTAIAGTGFNSWYRSTQLMRSGRWKAEFTWSGANVGSGNTAICIMRSDAFNASSSTANHFTTANGVSYLSDGTRNLSTSSAAYGATWTTGDRITIEADLDANVVRFLKNGTTQGDISFTPTAGADYMFVVYSFGNASPPVCDANFGQRAFTDSSTFNALNTTNLPTPAIPRSSDGFAAVLATESNIDTTLATARANYSQWVEITKNRTSVETWAWRFSHDSANEYAVSTTATRQTKRTNSGADNWVGYAINIGNTYGTAAGSVSHTNGVATTVTHNLTRSRNAVLLFPRAGGDVWFYHPDLTAGSLLKLNAVDAQAANTSITSVGSNSFQIGAGVTTGTYDYLVLGEVEGFLRLARHTGNASTDGPNNWYGAKPRWALFKEANSTLGWSVYDTARNPSNPVTNLLVPQLADAEFTSGFNIDILASGAKPRTATYPNNSGITYVSIIFAEAPFKFSTAR